MGPPPFGDGNVAFSLPGILAFLGPSMGPPPFGDGNPCGGRLENLHVLAFNGATAFRRWKLVVILSYGSSQHNPFNGATAFRRWKPGHVSPLRFHLSVLQWGHRLSAMETGLHVFRAVDGELPSMGPPPFGDGNISFSIELLTPDTDLQWGHRLSAMETASLTRSFHRRPSTFNGATAFRRWKPAIVYDGRTWSVYPFNGATAFRRWKLGLAVNETSRRYVLQWGHRLSAMETWNITAGFSQSITYPSMGPPPFGDGNAGTVKLLLVLLAEPSMGPPPFGDGNVQG